MRKIHLHGHLRRFGNVFEMDVASPAEAIRAIGYQIKGFFQAVREGEYHLILGDFGKGLSLDETEINFQMGKQKDFHIVPAVKGSKSNMVAGAIKTVIGITLIAASLGAATAGIGLTAAGGFFGSTDFTIAALGVSMTLAGIGTMLTPSQQKVNQTTSYLFNGATNTTDQGVPVPIVYGQMLVGSVCATFGLQVANM